MPAVIHERKIKESRFANVLVKELLNSNNPSISIAKIKLSGKNQKEKNISCHNFYYVINGSGKFTIRKKKYNVTKGDLISIPKGAVYEDEGKLTMLGISVPKFDPKKVIFYGDKS